MFVFARMKVVTRLYSLIGFLLFLLILIGYIGLKNDKNTDDRLDTIYKDRVVPLKELKVIADMYAVNIVDTSHKVRNGSLTWAEGRKIVHEATITIDKNWQAYNATYLVDSEKKLISEIKPLMKSADLEVAKLSQILAREDLDALQKFASAELYPAIDPVSGTLSQLVDVVDYE